MILNRKSIEEVCKINTRVINDTTVTYITFNSLDKIDFVRNCFSTRLGGVSEGIFSSMNLSYTRGDIKESVDENYRRIAAIMECKPEDIVCSQQTHTTNVKKITRLDCGNGIVRDNEFQDIDGMITNEPGIVLVTLYADCVPLYVVDMENRAIGLSHSGWKGTVNKMGQSTLAKMAEEYGTKPQNVKVVIGPSICQDCYEVSEDVAIEFEKAFTRDDSKAKKFLSRYKSISEITDEELPGTLFYRKENGKYQLNLWYANYRVFADAGVPDENIEITDVCTCCNSEVLFSHRASQGKRGNLGAFLGLV